jgi:hypothetical protein
MASSYDIFSDTEFGYALDEALREFSQYIPHLIPQPYKLEYRTGTDTTGTASYLTDATESQFVAADATEYKVVKNTTDNTWAVVTSYSSTSVLGLSADIMDSGESYEMYNPGCSDHKSINIANTLADCLNIDHVEWPLGTRRNFTLNGDILTLDIASDPSETDDLYVWVYANYPHFITDMTDLAGAVNNASGYSAGDTSMALNGLDSSGTVEQGQEFTLVGSRNKYRVTTDATISTNAATIYFWPALDIAVANAAVVTFVKTTLTQQTEQLVTELAAAKAALNKPLEHINNYCGASHWTNIDTLITASTTQATSALTALSSGYSLIVDNRTAAETAIGVGTTAFAQGRTDIASGLAKVIDQVDEAETQLDLATARIAQAVTDIAAARTYFNTVNINNPETAYLQSGQGELQTAQSYFGQAKDYLAFSATTNSGYLGHANAEYQAGMGKLAEARALLEADSQAVGNYIRQAMAQIEVGKQRLQDAQTQVSMVNAKSMIPKIAQYYETWGQNKLQRVMPTILRLASHQRGGPRVSTWESDE